MFRKLLATVTTYFDPFKDLFEGPLTTESVVAPTHPDAFEPEPPSASEMARVPVSSPTPTKGVTVDSDKFNVFVLDAEGMVPTKGDSKAWATAGEAEMLTSKDGKTRYLSGHFTNPEGKRVNFRAFTVKPNEEGGKKRPAMNLYILDAEGKIQKGDEHKHAVWTNLTKDGTKAYLAVTLPGSIRLQFWATSNTKKEGKAA